MSLLLIMAEKGARGDIQRPMGALCHPNGRDRRPDLQHGGNGRNHEDDLEATQRSRQELATRLQGTGKSRINHHIIQPANAYLPPYLRSSSST